MAKSLSRTPITRSTENRECAVQELLLIGQQRRQRGLTSPSSGVRSASTVVNAVASSWSACWASGMLGVPRSGRYGQDGAGLLV